MPMTDVRGLHLDGRDINEHGFIATLATENGVEVDLTYDPGSDEESRDMNRQRGETVTIWLGVRHPVTEKLCAARLEGDRAVYDFWCGDENGCLHDHGGWFEYVRSPEDVFDRLPHLGRLKVKGIIDAPHNAAIQP